MLEGIEFFIKEKQAILYELQGIKSYIDDLYAKDARLDLKCVEIVKRADDVFGAQQVFNSGVNGSIKALYGEIEDVRNIINSKKEVSPSIDGDIYNKSFGDFIDYILASDANATPSLPYYVVKRIKAQLITYVNKKINSVKYW